MNRQVILIVFAILWAGLQAWNHRFELYNDDAIEYIDIAKSLVNGNFALAINPYWSPLYSWLIALGEVILHPKGVAEIVLLKLLNFSIFIFTFCSFIRLVKVTLSRRQSDEMLPRNETIQALALGGFIALTLGMGGTHIDTPDMLSYGLLYLASAELLLAPTGLLANARMGLWLGLGYLTKAIILPVSCVFFVLAFLRNKANASVCLKSTLVAILTMLVVAIPHMMAISKQTGKLTFSEAGGLNYAWYVSRSADFLLPNFTLNKEYIGQYKHLPEVMIEKPRTLLFDKPFDSSFAAWLAPHYWFDGFAIEFSAWNQFIAILASVFFFTRYFYLPVFLGLCLLMVLNRSFNLAIKLNAPVLELALPSLFALGLYSVALNCNTLYSSRYFCAYFVLLYFALLTSVSISKTKTKQGKNFVIAQVVTLALLFVPGVFNIIENLECLAKGNKNQAQAICERLSALGIRDGARVMLVDPVRKLAFAVVGNYKVVAESRDFESLRNDPKQCTDQMLDRCAKNKIEAIYIDNSEMKAAPDERWKAVFDQEQSLYVIPVPWVQSK